ncbi:MAG: competence/damage-inducible protein A, partial [Armatimonadetes bacterium]|nr:competence/damage-inducible protein A [Armatimonadota bacterium]
MGKPPCIELFAIGTELVLGRIQDTNSFWMSQRIASLGGNLRRVTLLPDDLEEIIRALQDSLTRGTDIVVTCGGLGPTPDDLTMEAVARVARRSLTIHDATLADYVRRRNLSGPEEVSPGLRKMATIPEGSQVFQNPAGWAPCTVVPAANAAIVILPGPPREMEAVFTMYVADYIASRTANRSAALRVRVDMFESEASPVMQEVMRRCPGTYLKAYVAMRDGPTQMLPVDIVANGNSDEDVHRILREAVQQ